MKPTYEELKAQNLALVAALKNISEFETDGQTGPIKPSEEAKIAKYALSISPQASMEALQEIVGALKWCLSRTKQLDFESAVIQIIPTLETAITTAEKVFGIKG